MATKMRDQSWHDLPRQSRLARVLWPQLMEKQYHAELKEMGRREGKTDPLTARGGKGQQHQTAWWETKGRVR
jgi:hypothetical protein